MVRFELGLYGPVNGLPDQRRRLEVYVVIA